MNRKHEQAPGGTTQEGDEYDGAQYRQENDDSIAYAAGQGRSKPKSDGRARPGNNPSGASASAATGGSTSGGATAAASDSTGPRRDPVDPQR